MMTRSPHATSLSIGSTLALRTSVEYGDALKYTLQDGVPLCYLRPVKNTKGQCHFSFPLYSPDGDAGGRMLGVLESRALEAAEAAAEAEFDATAYTLTEEEEMAVMGGGRGGDPEEEEEIDEEALCGDGSGDGGDVCGSGEEEEELETPPQAIFNSDGRPALGCVLGARNMPTLCAAYPLAHKGSWADFW